MTIVLTGLFEQDFWLEASFFFYYAKPKAPRIPGSSEAGIVPVPTKCELDQLEKDTNPKVWWIREKMLFCLQWGSKRCFVLMLQSHTTHVEAWRREHSQPQKTDSSNGLTSEGLKKWGWSHSVCCHWSWCDWALQSLFRCLIISQPSAMLSLIIMV